MRKPFVAGNWKMFTTTASAQELAGAVVKGLGGDTRVQVALCPPFPYLYPVGQALQGSPVALGGQNLYPRDEGAFTGEVSAKMLLDVGCRYVILGHSERRHKMGETDAFINEKVRFALKSGLGVILCVGETLEEREASTTEQVLDRQTTKGLEGLTADALANVVIAYEPVWAIGTGRNATPEQAQEAHAFLRRRLQELFGAPAAQRMVIQYGGSIKANNFASIISQPDVDGGLVGGASLDAAEFLKIIQHAQAAVK